MYNPARLDLISSAFLKEPHSNGGRTGQAN
jgi:hypothetical protein